METYTIDLADLQELIRGNPVAVGPVRVVLDASQLDAALEALVPLSLRDPDHTKIGVGLLREAGIDLDDKKR